VADVNRKAYSTAAQIWGFEGYYSISGKSTSRFLLFPLRHKVVLVRFAQLLARHVNNLLHVAAEVGDAVEQGGGDGGVEALDAARRNEIVGGELRDDRVGFGHGGLKLLQNFVLRPLRMVGKFLGAVANVGRAADARDDPLSHVAGQMQH
jgi:hypothetical protein